jgi:hypothetical protein
MWLSAATAMAQIAPQIRVLVKVDPRIEGYLRAGETPQLLNDELSAALTQSILNGGKWWQFCWDLAPNGQTDAELDVQLNKDLAGNWEIAAMLNWRQGTQRFSQDFPGKAVLTKADLTTYGQPSRADLPKDLARWFSSHYLAVPVRDQLHQHLCKNLPVGHGVITLAPQGSTYSLKLPNRFEHFQYSIFKFICRENGIPVPIEVEGIGSVLPAMGNPAVTLIMRPRNPGGPKQCADATAYLLRFVVESELGGLPVF